MNPPPTPGGSNSKLPRFLQKAANVTVGGRDRSKSFTSPPDSQSSMSSAAPTGRERPPRRSSRHSSALLRNEDENNHDNDPEAFVEPDTPSIVEPQSPVIPSGSESSTSHSSYRRPQSDIHLAPSSSVNLSSRLSGWLHHFSSSSTDLPSLALSATAAASPRLKAAGILTAARQGKDKALRYLLDTDVAVSTHPGEGSMWILGVEHHALPSPAPSIPQSPSTSSQHKSHPQQVERQGWPQSFISDFTSRIWLTYRSGYPPIRDVPLSSLNAPSPNPNESPTPNFSLSLSSSPKKWNWGEKTWTTDTGWGCMLRTGQCVLAQALVVLHLGRDFRIPTSISSSSSSPTQQSPPQWNTQQYQTYIKLLTYFLDSPSPACPFSVHRMALAGKETGGKDVGQWFGPSTAAGALKTLVKLFPECGLQVSIAVDGVVYESDVYAASSTTSDIHSAPPSSYSLNSGSDNPGYSPHKSPYSPSRRKKKGGKRWEKAVLVLIGIRLGLEGVNPVYYPCIKALLSFPQSVGIAGGRPSSSYYFIGYQGDCLFYLDPHYARPTVPLRSENGNEREKEKEKDKRPWRTGAPGYSGIDSSSERDGPGTGGLFNRRRHQSPSSTSSSPNTKGGHLRTPTSPTSSVSSTFTLTSNGDDSLSYTTQELRTFHCDKVRKMPLSSMDPSMLIGFLVKDEDEWRDLKRRVSEMPKTIFSFADEPPNWPSDMEEDMGLESVSEPDADVDVEYPSSPEPETSATTTARGEEDELDKKAASDPHPKEKKNVGLGVSIEGGDGGADTPGLTPGPRSRFPIREDDDEEDVSSPPPPETDQGAEADEDDWVVDPLRTPSTSSSPVPLPIFHTPSNGRVTNAHQYTSSKHLYTSSGSSSSKDLPPSPSSPSSPPPPPPHTISTSPIPIQFPRAPSQEQYPFPLSSESESESSPPRVRRASGLGLGAPVAPGLRSANLKARDGGRTKSGGVRGVRLVE